MKRASHGARMLLLDCSTRHRAFRIQSPLLVPESFLVISIAIQCLDVPKGVGHSRGNGHSDYSLVLLLTNQAAVNICVEGFGCGDLFFLGKHTGMGLLGTGCGCACKGLPLRPQRDRVALCPHQQVLKVSAPPASLASQPLRPCAGLSLRAHPRSPGAR